MKKKNLYFLSDLWVSSSRAVNTLNVTEKPGTHYTAHAGCFILGGKANLIFLSNKKTRTERYPSLILRQFIFPEEFSLRTLNQQSDGFYAPNRMEAIKAFPEGGFAKGTLNTIELTSQLTIPNKKEIIKKKQMII